MLNIAQNTKQKKQGLWDKLKLRGRLLTIMLTVALAAVLVCVTCFAFTLNRMLSGSREDARNLSENVHRIVEMAFYQQEMHIRQTYAMAQADFLNRRLAQIRKNNETPEWEGLAKEAYDLVDNWPGATSTVLTSSGSAVFLYVGGEFHVYDGDKNAFLEAADNYYNRYIEEGYVNAGRSFIGDMQDNPSSGGYITGEGGMILVWCVFDNNAGQVGILTPNTNALRMSEGLRELMDTETGMAVDNITSTAQQAALWVLLAIAVLLIALPLASRRLALVVVNPVEQEQERQRNLLRVAEEEKAMLERLDRLKTEFLGNVSHELKTPLTVMSGYAQYSQKTLAGVPEMAEVENRMKLITSEADRLALLVTQILDVTKIEEGRMMVNPRPASIISVIQRTLNTYYPVFAKNNNKLKIERSGEISNVLCDEARVSQVLVNLIANAAKHTRDGLITVSAGVEGSFAVVTVADNGEGIAPERLPLLFERFKSHDSEDEKNRAGRETGTGLGLYISKHIIDAHGGEITIESAIGEGTTVRFTLPLET